VSDVAIVADATNKVHGKADEAIEANVVEKAKTDEAIQAIESPLDDDEADADNKIHLVDVANEVNETKSNEVDVSVELPLLIPFSLTKYSAIFAEVKGSFEIDNNQLEGFAEGCLSPCSLMIRFVCTSESVFKNLWIKICSLQSQCIN
jgi:hypothetical protein